jgi:hypothetical protein
MYIKEILYINNCFYDDMKGIILSLSNKLHSIIRERINIDENELYLKIGMENWLHFINNKNKEEILNNTTSEDIIRLK